MLLMPCHMPIEYDRIRQGSVISTRTSAVSGEIRRSRPRTGTHRRMPSVADRYETVSRITRERNARKPREAWKETREPLSAENVEEVVKI